MLIIDNVTVRIGGREILEGANAAISYRPQVGLLAGKRALSNPLLGHLEPEPGKVEPPRSGRVGGGAQEPPESDASLVETVLAADLERTRLLEAVEREQDPAMLGEIHARLEEISAY